MAKGSLAVRAGLAVTLMVLFYALAAAAIGGLVWVGIHLGMSLEHTRGRGVIFIGLLALVCVGAALVIAWSVLPRWDRFEPPGVEVVAADHPELFVEIERIAEATGQRKPAHVYLVPEVNAFVAQRGGIMGIGSQRVMGIGLPLMRTLQVDELRAVLAHEMGHFYGGDTKLGPWIYKTRGALARTVVNLNRAGEHAAELDLAGLVFVVIKAPFRWFLIGFMRISQAISRAQEYSADAVAVRAEGQRALIEGLKKTHAAALAHSLYMRHEVAPLVHLGKLPDVGDGFSRYLASEHMAKLLDKVVEHELAEGAHDPYDSHPPLRERIAAAGEVEGPQRESDPRSAIELIRDAESLERGDIERQVDTRLEHISWADSAAVWEKMWRDDVMASRAVMVGIPAERFATDLMTIYRHANQILGEGTVADMDDGSVRGWWSGFVGTALAVRLLDGGFTVSSLPGAPNVFTRGDDKVELFIEVQKRIAGETSNDDWLARCEALGFAGRTLAD